MFDLQEKLGDVGRVSLDQLSDVALSINKRLHLAILREPYLSLVIDGIKTIESRLTTNKVAPYGKVEQGDVLLLKKASGPILGLATVSKVEYFQGIGRAAVVDLFAKYADEIQASDTWVDRKSSCRYVSLFHLAHVIPISPIHVEKRDQRPWVTFEVKRQERLG